MLILFDRNEKQIERLMRDELIACIQTEPLNGIVYLDFTVDFGAIDRMEGAVYAAHRDAINPNEIQMYKIVRQEPDNNGMAYQAVHIVHDELKSYGYVKDRRLNGVQAGAALLAALSGSRWEVGQADPTEIGSVHFFDNSRQECLSKILEAWPVELGYRLVISGNRVVKRYIDLYNKRGTETGRRYVYGQGALQVVREESQADLYTAAIGRGKGEEKYDQDGNSTGGFGRRISFADVAWSKAAGDPVDKPAGQEYVEIPEMTALYGYSDGSPRMKVCVYQDIEDPKELLKATYADLLIHSRPLVQFEAVIAETGNLELGDTVAIIRKELGIFYKTRVFSVQRDLLTGSMAEIKLGDNLEITQADYNKQLKNDIKAAESDMNSTVDSAVSALQTILANSMFDDDAYYYRLKLNNEWGLPAGQYTFNRPLDQNPTKALYFGAGKMAFANSKDSQGDWRWTTWATGDGLVADAVTTGTLLADLIKAGILSDVRGRFSINLATGAINFDNDLIYDPTTRTLTIGGMAKIAAAAIKEGVFDSARIPNLVANKIDGGDLNIANNIRFRNMTLDDFIKGLLNTPTFSTGFRSDQPATMKGASMAFGANSQYISMRDTGGRGEMRVKGTVAAYGSGYDIEMNAGGLSLNSGMSAYIYSPNPGAMELVGHVWFNHFKFKGKWVFIDDNGFLKV